LHSEQVPRPDCGNRRTAPARRTVRRIGLVDRQGVFFAAVVKNADAHRDRTSAKCAPQGNQVRTVVTVGIGHGDHRALAAKDERGPGHAAVVRRHGPRNRAGCKVSCQVTPEFPANHAQGRNHCTLDQKLRERAGRPHIPSGCGALYMNDNYVVQESYVWLRRSLPLSAVGSAR
jgi:hypothetical protein